MKAPRRVRQPTASEVRGLLLVLEENARMVRRFPPKPRTGTQSADVEAAHGWVRSARSCFPSLCPDNKYT